MSRCLTFTQLVVLTLLATSLETAHSAEDYRMPPRDVAALVDRLATPAVRLSPNRKHVLFLERTALVPASQLAEPRARLAGLAIDTRRNANADAPRYTAARLVDLESRETTPVAGLPRGAELIEALWAPDASAIALLVAREDRIELWSATPGGEARRLSERRINAVFDAPCAWLPDAHGLVCRLLPDERPALAPEVPAPKLRESEPGGAPAPTYAGLLRSATDEARFERYAAARLAAIGLDGSARWLSGAQILTQHSVSPDGRWVLAESLERPYSRALPWDRFARRVEVVELAAGRARTLASIPLEPGIGIETDAASEYPRGHAWRADAPATVFWATAQDGGDPAREAAVRDRAFLWEAPFESEPRVLADFPMRLEEIWWARDDLALAQESWWKTRRSRLLRLAPGQAGAGARELRAYSSEDREARPGAPITRQNNAGHAVLELDGDEIALASVGAGPRGDQPALRRLNAATGELRSAWRADASHYEFPAAVLPGGALLTLRESAAEPPRWTLRRGPAAEPLLPESAPALPRFPTRLLRYRRGDGLELSGTLTLPPGHAEGAAPLPVLLMAYPLEFQSDEAAGRVAGSPNRYRAAFLGGPLAFALQGYAVLSASMPVVARGGGEPNDSFNAQLVDNAASALRELRRLGIGDPWRAAVAGHSYGATMAASLLAWSDLFCAGIAMSGAYNRTLTPFGFQSEERTLWKARPTYLAMSPLLHADEIRAPLLLVHGEEDPNPGTQPQQSERLYDALAGLGRRARLVLLPGEGHGYRGRESVLHVLAESIAWLERWVRNGKGCARP